MISSRLFSQRITRSSHSSISRITYWTRTLTTTTWTGTCTTTTKTTATANVLIVGGGPVGCSTAYHLALSRQGDGRGIVVLEKDATYAQASATLSAGGIRQQFSLLQNVQMSLYGMEFLRHAHEWLSINNDNNNKNDKNKNNKKKNKTEQQDHNIVNVQLEEHGYLFLASSEQGRLQMLQNHVTQRAAGATTIDLLTPEQLRMEFPWLDTSNLVLGSFGRSGEGWFDPWSLIQGLKRKCQAMGVTFVNGTPLGSIRERHALTGNVIQQQTIRAVHVLEYPSSKNQVTTTTTTGTTKTYTVDYVVNAAGPHCRSVLNLLAGAVAEEEEGGRLRYPLPVQPRKRCIFYVHCPKAETISKTNNRWIAPLTICPKTGVYFRSASVATSAANSHGSDGGGGGGYFLCGVSPQPDQDPNVYVEPTTTTTTQRQGDDDKINNNHHNYYMSTTITTPTAQDYETLFEETIWPAMYNLVPDYFDELKVHSSWAGLYEYNTVDQNGIIDFHPELTNVLMVNGFSGHGLQHSPASGRAAAELLEFNGQFQTLDLRLLNFTRLMRPELHQHIEEPPQEPQQSRRRRQEVREEVVVVAQKQPPTPDVVSSSPWPPLVWEQAIV